MDDLHQSVKLLARRYGLADAEVLADDLWRRVNEKALGTPGLTHGESLLHRDGQWVSALGIAVGVNSGHTLPLEPDEEMLCTLVRALREEGKEKPHGTV